MAVAMASSGTNLGLCSNMKAVEKQPSARFAPFRCSFGLDPVQGFCLFSKKRFLLLSLVS